MPSRRPPSQRDPQYALHRLPGTVAQAAPGLKVKNASPVKTATPNRTAPATAAPAGGVVATDFRGIWLEVYAAGGGVQMPSSASVWPYVYASAKSFQDVAVTVQMQAGGTVQMKTVSGDTYDYTEGNYEVLRMADSTGAAVTPTREGLSGNWFSRTSGAITNSAYAGTLISTSANNSLLSFSTAGLYLIYGTVKWT